MVIKSEFEKKMDVIREEHLETLDDLNEDIKYVECLRNEYEENKSAYKGFIFLFKLYGLNSICTRIASMEMFTIVAKFLGALFFYTAAYMFNSLFISKGYFTGVNGYVIACFLLFTIVFIVHRSNSKTKELLEISQESLREYKFKIFN